VRRTGRALPASSRRTVDSFEQRWYVNIRVQTWKVQSPTSRCDLDLAQILRTGTREPLNQVRRHSKRHAFLKLNSILPMDG
jgi:hypothetical protein